MKNSLKFVLLLIVSIVYYSCNKEEEKNSPLFRTALIPTTEKLIGTWKVKSVNNQPLPADSLAFYLDGNHVYKRLVDNVEYSFLTGTWSWNDINQQEITISYSSTWKVWKINFLSESEFEFTEDISNYKYECIKN